MTLPWSITNHPESYNTPEIAGTGRMLWSPPHPLPPPQLARRKTTVISATIIKLLFSCLCLSLRSLKNPSSLFTVDIVQAEFF